MKLSRRMFLQGAGGVTVGLPLLEATSGRAWAQEQGPRRLIIFMTPQGFIMDAWRPTGSQANWQLSPILQPLAPFKSKLNVVQRLINDVNTLNRNANAHNPAARTLLTCQPFSGNVNANGTLRSASRHVENGFANGPSIDQVIAQRLNAGTPFRTIDLGIGGSDVNENQLLHAAADDPVTLLGDPRDVFNRLFLNLPSPGSGGEPPPPPPPTSTIDRIRARRGSILDTVHNSFSRLQARLGSADRARLEAHAEKIRDLEMRFGDTPVGEPPGPPPSVSCEQPTLPTFPSRYSPSNANYDDVSARAMIDEMVMAMICDLTRVGTLQFTKYHGPTFPWLDANVPGNFTDWHAMIHDPPETASRTTRIQVMTWYAEMFAYFLQRLDAVQEGDRTLLDNSLVVWVSEFGDGSTHSTEDLPVVTAGGLGGRVPTD
ncbi:MAG: DUF1552 domain-containing protein, partial [Myxococcota bacterium]